MEKAIEERIVKFWKTLGRFYFIEGLPYYDCRYSPDEYNRFLKWKKREEELAFSAQNYEYVEVLDFLSDLIKNIDYYEYIEFNQKANELRNKWLRTDDYKRLKRKEAISNANNLTLAVSIFVILPAFILWEIFTG